MKHITRRFLCVTIFLLFASQLQAQDTLTKYLIVHPTSSICIRGNSNISKYQCAIEKLSGTDTLVLAAHRSKGAYFKRGWVSLNTSRFDCGMNAITNDFRKSIQSDIYPYIIIQFISFERVPKFSPTEEQLLGKVIIKLANKAVPCEVRCSIAKDKNNVIHLSGNHCLKFSDFGLTPPQKMKGMIQVEEDIIIDFHLMMTMMK